MSSYCYRWHCYCPMFAVPSACDACLGSQQMFAVLDFQIPLDLACWLFEWLAL